MLRVLFVTILIPAHLGVKLRLRDPIETPLEQISPQLISTEDESQYPTINADGSVSAPTEAPTADPANEFVSGTTSDYAIVPNITASVSSASYVLNGSVDVCGSGYDKKLGLLYGCPPT